MDEWSVGFLGAAAQRVLRALSTCFLDFFYSTSFSASVCFTDVGCFYFKRILSSSDRLFPTVLCIGFTFFLLKHITVLFFFVRSPFAKSFCGAALLPPLGRRRKRWLQCDIERKLVISRRF